MENTDPKQGRTPSLVARLALFGGPLLSFGFVLLFDLDPARPAVTRTAAVALLMAVWWISEAVPLSITALLPVALFPLLGVMNGKTVAAQYFNHIIFLFMGGFIVALAMEKWNLHKRIALRILLLFGGEPRRILLGFMLATAFLSMWISNTAASMMIVAIALAVLVELEDEFGRKQVAGFAVALMLGVAYGASVGGIATLVGTPPNMSFTRIFEISFPNPDTPQISFARWFAFAVPVSLLMLAFIWWFLAFRYLRRETGLRVERRILRDQLEALGPISFAEAVVLADFALLVVLWLTRVDIHLGDRVLYGWSNLFPNPEYINDGTVAIALAIVLFVVPSSRKPATPIMDWQTAVRLPWGIVLLFGGGFALAAAFIESGLSDWLGSQLAVADQINPFVLVLILCLAMTFLTELTSNTATTEMILPLLAGLSVAIEVNPLLLMIPVTISCSCAFMMPVATPPNAIVFGSGRLRIADMAKTGLIINVVGVLIIAAVTYLFGEAVWGIHPDQLPAWAKP